MSPGNRSGRPSRSTNSAARAGNRSAKLLPLASQRLRLSPTLDSAHRGQARPRTRAAGLALYCREHSGHCQTQVMLLDGRRSVGVRSGRTHDTNSDATLGWSSEREPRAGAIDRARTARACPQAGHPEPRFARTSMLVRHSRLHAWHRHQHLSLALGGSQASSRPGRVSFRRNCSSRWGATSSADRFGRPCSVCRHRSAADESA
jgi:hypothetical protein